MCNTTFTFLQNLIYTRIFKNHLNKGPTMISTLEDLQDFSLDDADMPNGDPHANAHPNAAENVV